MKKHLVIRICTQVRWQFGHFSGCFFVCIAILIVLVVVLVLVFSRSSYSVSFSPDCFLIALLQAPKQSEHFNGCKGSSGGNVSNAIVVEPFSHCLMPNHSNWTLFSFLVSNFIHFIFWFLVIIYFLLFCCFLLCLYQRKAKHILSVFWLIFYYFICCCCLQLFFQVHTQLSLEKYRQTDDILSIVIF